MQEFKIIPKDGKYAIKYRFLLFGDKGIYIAALVAGLADVDAIVLTLSSLALTGLEPRVAVLGIILAVCSNTLVKIGIAYFSGDKKMAKRVLIILVLSLIVGISVALLVWLENFYSDLIILTNLLIF